ncbi:MAG: chromosomal replication initiator protein DnaA [Actinomycetota bacterium]|nr:chromosomal replication initiator protein DnaA [Actinomycetota bacterium]
MELPAHLEVAPAWHEIQAQLRRTVGDSTYEIWLASLEPQSLSSNVLIVKAPLATEAWVAKRFGRIVERGARSVLGSEVKVAFTGQACGMQDAMRTQSAVGQSPVASLNPRYNFQQFIIGDGNRLAHAGALAVAELPGQAYNPLFLHAPPGLGKTHLLHAIGNYILAFGGGAVVRYTTVEAFTNHFIAALSSRSIEQFKRAYRDADALLIDDVQFLASKAKTEEEFFHTFNSLYETGRQLVLTCDRLPHQLVGVEERLRERFQSGLVADIRPPDLATRVAILRKRAALDRVPLADPAVLEVIAERVTDNVRVLEGALIRVVAYHSLARRPIDVELATTVLDGMYPPSVSTSLSAADVKGTVASYFELSVSELVSSSRAARVMWPRQVAIYLTREFTDRSLVAIGRAFGDRNHATVLHACKRVADRLSANQHAAAEVTAISDQIRAGQGDRRY